MILIVVLFLSIVVLIGTVAVLILHSSQQEPVTEIVVNKEIITGAAGTEIRPVGGTAEDAGETEIKEPEAQEVPEETDSESEEEKEPEPSPEEVMNDRVNAIISEMSIEEKIYQLFVVTPEALTGVDTAVAAGNGTKSSLEKRPVGGLIYFAANLTSPNQAKEMLSNTQKFADEIEGMPLFLCIDEEGGKVARIGNNSAFGVKKVGAMAAVKSKEEAYSCGDTIGEYLSDIGFNVDFAPDADVITNSSNTVIGDRSFGTDPQIVSDYAAAYSDGLHAHGIMSTYKHFPGHGATEADTHKGYAYTNKTYEELMESELVPFTKAGEKGVDFVMVAHIALPNVIGDDTPCSLSKKMMTDILRQDLAYDGIIITDALNMGAVSQVYSSSTAAVKAFKAGADMLLMPADLSSAYQGIYDACEKGDISEERIDESLRRIIRAKLGTVEETTALSEDEGKGAK